MSSVTNAEDTYKIEPLQGSANYRTWKFSMRMVLQAKDLWELVSGDEEKPEAEKAAQAWEKKARKALAAIALALSAAEKEHIIECVAPKAAWDILEKLYEGKGQWVLASDVGPWLQVYVEVQLVVRCKQLVAS